MMKFKTHALNSFHLLLLYLALPLLSAFYFNQLQDITVDRNFLIKGSSFINLESIVGYSVASQAQLDHTEYCSLHQVSLEQTSQIPFEGVFSKDDKAIYSDGYYYVMKNDPQSAQASLLSYKQSDPNHEKTNKLIAAENRVFETDESNEKEIIDMKQYGITRMIRTRTKIIILELSSSASPSLTGILTASKGLIKDFGKMGDQRVFVAESSNLVVYSFILQGKSLKPLTSISSFSGDLPADSKLEIKDIQTICICGDFLFIGTKDYILMANGAQDLENKKDLPIIKWRKMSSIVLKIERAGRSLVVLTETDLTEFLFVNDYLDLKVNIHVNNAIFAFGYPIPIYGSRDYVDIKTSDNGTYFALVNKMEGTFYIFQSAVFPTVEATQHPYLYSHKGSRENLHSLELYESFTSYSSNGLIIIMEGKGKINVINFKRNPLGVYCSKWVAGSATASVTAKSQFCHNTVYNYTKFIEEELKKNNKTIYNSDFYYDPIMPCNKTILIRIKFEWATKMFIAIIGVALGIIVTLLIVRKLWKRKEKQKTKTKTKVKKEEEKIQIKHQKFQNEKDVLSFDHSSHKIDVSHFNLPSTTDRNPSGGSGKENETTTIPASKRKKHFTKKKNLEIKIPEIPQ